MSKLYDAISNIESKRSKKDDIPKFNKKHKPPYFLIIVTVVFVAVLFVSAIIIKSRIVDVKHKEIAHKKSVELVFDNKTKQKKSAVKKIIKKPKLATDLKTKYITERAIKKPDIVKVKKNNTKIMEQSNGRIENKEVKATVAIKKNEDKEKDIKSSPVANSAVIKAKSDVNKLLNDTESSNDEIAISAYKKLIRRFPRKIELYNNLSVRYMNASDYKDAAEVLKKALQIKDDQDLKINLTIAYIKMHNYKMAKNTIKTIAQPKGKNIDIVNNINDFLNSQKLPRK